MPEIVLDNVSKKFGETVAADGLSLSIKDGEYVCILGPTGAGKTTCMRMICGLTQPDSGRVYLDGKDVTDDPVDTRNATMLTQSYALFPHMTVYDNVRFAPQIKDWAPEDIKQVVRSTLHMVHLEQKAEWMPAQLSGGQQQRIALARALASGSKVLLLDEPLRALDARLRINLRKELRTMAKQMGVTCIHVTHDQDEALAVADRIAIIRDGRIIQFGTPSEVFDDPATPFVATFVGRSNILTGKVVRSDGESTAIDVAGTVLLARPSPMEVGEEAVLAVKIGFTRISKKQEEIDAAYFTGTIDRVLYEGVTITVEINAGGLGLISSKLPNRKFDDYHAGDIVGVSWAPSKASVFRVPPEGLEKELKLE